MSQLNYSKMPFSFNDGWDKVGAVHPSALKTFLLLVLPFSLIPPAMLLYAGSHHASVYLMDAAFSRWQDVALVFLIAELFTVPLMGWIIKNIASVHKLSVDFKDAFLLAAITGVPMWLSSLGLAIPNMWAMIGVVILGFLAAVSMLYYGTFRIFKMDEQIEAQSMSFAAFSVGGIVWVLLCAFVVLPLMN
ncbi:MAG: YIP1 family protein [Glaciimonas sp.]|nr:YIP1 family protein [Glaciimonas sp.]